MHNIPSSITSTTSKRLGVNYAEDFSACQFHPLSITWQFIIDEYCPYNISVYPAKLINHLSFIKKCLCYCAQWDDGLHDVCPDDLLNNRFSKVSHQVETALLFLMMANGQGNCGKWLESSKEFFFLVSLAASKITWVKLSIMVIRMHVRLILLT